MAVKQIKVAEATELQLDWLVARIEGDELPKSGAKGLDYSVDWACGGPILEREAHNLFKHNGGTEWCCACNVPRDGYTAIVTADGPTPLIAAMRCYVASKLGDEAEVPEELV